MKKLALLLLSFTLLFACKRNTDVNSSLIGNWQLIETLSGPGDGSGTFQAVTSNKTVTFNANGTLSSNGDICNMSIDSNSPTSGTYDTTATSIAAGCVNAGIDITYVHNGTELIIRYPCFEPCWAKYQKVR